MGCRPSSRATISHLYLIPGVIIHTCNSRTEGTEAVGSPVQDPTVLHGKFRASLGHSKETGLGMELSGRASSQHAPGSGVKP